MGLSPVVSKQTIDPGQGTWASQGPQIRQSARTNSTEAVATAGGNTDMDAKCSAGAGDPTNPAEILDGDIASTLVALDTREVTSEALVRKCLTRSAAYDSCTEGLNSIVVANPLAVDRGGRIRPSAAVRPSATARGHPVHRQGLVYGRRADGGRRVAGVRLA